MPQIESSLLVAANRLHHREFTTPIMYCRDDNVLIGRIEGIAHDASWRTVDLVAFKSAFMADVDAYLQGQGGPVDADRGAGPVRLV
ncbi:hypothetical protein BV97_05603 [Novosphingobium resinovorum]|jgi:hypothetical protein|uniref:Uncharacterized protein n=1 Tax=Novosphingobium resinovorum TaxID=158500 RepID=A0A031J5M4_9SPHN|nr:hypothetical protein [Novosphingobium resinovorum]AOR81060.1 hypothetical protein BES08_29665 [Novosphingobium resinovorum]EZP68582.1 hypothetical protein BV97_05603 [Novosphingobium resinovorum]